MHRRAVISAASAALALSAAGCVTTEGVNQISGQYSPTHAHTRCTSAPNQVCEVDVLPGQWVPDTIEVRKDAKGNYQPLRWKLTGNTPFRFIEPGIKFEDSAWPRCTVSSNGREVTCPNAGTEGNRYKYKVYLEFDPWVLNR